VRWYGVLIVSGAILAGYLAARRARAHGIDDDHVWNQLLLGMLFGIICARIYYVAFEWPRYAGRPLLEIINPQGGGIAIHGAIIGALASLISRKRITIAGATTLRHGSSVTAVSVLARYPSRCARNHSVTPAGAAIGAL